MVSHVNDFISTEDADDDDRMKEEGKRGGSVLGLELIFDPLCGLGDRGRVRQSLSV